MEWISVKIQLPKVGEKVLLKHPLFGIHRGYFTRTNHWSDNRHPQFFSENDQEYRSLDLKDKYCDWHWNLDI